MRARIDFARNRQSPPTQQQHKTLQIARITATAATTLRISTRPSRQQLWQTHIQFEVRNSFAPSPLFFSLLSFSLSLSLSLSLLFIFFLLNYFFLLLHVAKHLKHFIVVRDFDQQKIQKKRRCDGRAHVLQIIVLLVIVAVRELWEYARRGDQSLHMQFVK